MLVPQVLETQVCVICSCKPAHLGSLAYARQPVFGLCLGSLALQPRCLIQSTTHRSAQLPERRVGWLHHALPCALGVVPAPTAELVSSKLPIYKGHKRHLGHITFSGMAALYTARLACHACAYASLVPLHLSTL